MTIVFILVSLGFGPYRSLVFSKHTEQQVKRVPFYVAFMCDSVCSFFFALGFIIHGLEINLEGPQLKHLIRFKGPQLGHLPLF